MDIGNVTERLSVTQSEYPTPSNFREKIPGLIMDLSKAAIEIRKERRSVGFDTYDITIKQIIDMVVEEQINISPDYQRKFVWDQVRQSQLIESIFLGIPVPSLFMATNDDSTWEVIDGLQRITTLIRYTRSNVLAKTELSDQPLRLKGLVKIPSLNGACFEDLPSALSISFLTRPVRITVLNDNSDFKVRFDLFERLNTGGITLHEQEIRNCVYQGKFNDFIKDCAADPRLNKIIKRNDKSGRGNVEELVLKFFAYFEDRAVFQHSVRDFLNDYMEKKTGNFSNRKFLGRLFNAVLDELFYSLPNGVARSSRPNSTPLVLFEAIAVGVADVIAKEEIVDRNLLSRIVDDENLKSLTTGATNSYPKLKARIDYVYEHVRA